MLINPEQNKTSWGKEVIFINKEIPATTPIEAGIFECEPGASLELHVHETGDEYCYLFAGQGVFVIAGQEYKVETGQAIKIPRGIEHLSYNNGDQTFRSFFIVCP